MSPYYAVKGTASRIFRGGKRRTEKMVNGAILLYLGLSLVVILQTLSAIAADLLCDGRTRAREAKKKKMAWIKNWVGPWGSTRATAMTAVLSFWAVALLGATALLWTERFTDFNHFHMEAEVVEIAAPGAHAPETATRAVVRPHAERGLAFKDAMFFSTSALCVTGLATRDFSAFTFEGQVVILLLVQIGGIGVTTLAAMLLVLASRKTREMLATSAGAALVDVGLPSGGKPLALLRHVAFYTTLIEGIGALVLWCSLPEAALRGVSREWAAIFLAVSAFDNAGFAPWGDNLMALGQNPLPHLTVGGLIVLGGIGYPVLAWAHVGLKRLLRMDPHRAQAQLKVLGASELELQVMLRWTFGFIFAGTVIPAMLEWNNPSLQGLSAGHKLAGFLFHSISPRTAGFNVFDLGQLGALTNWLYIVMMTCGAGPASCAGGWKLTTIAAIVAYLRSWRRTGLETPRICGIPIERESMRAALRVVMGGVVFHAATLAALMFFEREWTGLMGSPINPFSLLFENHSAIGTVGLSLGFAGATCSLAGILSSGSVWTLIVGMQVGRVGLLNYLAFIAEVGQAEEGKSEGPKPQRLLS